MDDTIESSIEVKNEKKLKNNVICLTANKFDYERIEAEVRFDEDSPKDYSTCKSVGSYEQTSPSPFSKDDYLEISPHNVAKQSLGSSTTENIIKYQNGLENEAVTSL